MLAISDELKTGFAKNDSRNSASGTYFYRLEAGSFTDIKKMILIK